MDIEETLEDLGLSTNEIKVYLACLEKEGSNVKEISKRTKLIRTTIYGVLDTLLNKGMVSQSKKGKVMHFFATDLKEVIFKLEQKIEKITSIIPEIEKLKNFLRFESKIESYEGPEGVKVITEDIISKPNQIVKVIGAGKKWVEFSKFFALVYYRKKKERKVKTKTILSDTPEERSFLKEKNYLNSEFKFIKGIDVTRTATFIYQDKVSFVCYEKGKERGFIVKDIEFNRVQNIFFDRLWKDAKS